MTNSSTKRPTIGILLCGHNPPELEQEHGHYDQMFKDLLGEDTFDYATYPVLTGKFPEHVHAADGWILTGSRHGAYEDHDWIPPLEEFIRSAMAEQVPVLGICFGHQVMAQALGGKVEKFSGGWVTGRVSYRLDLDADPTSGTTELADADLGASDKDSAESIKLLAWHQDQVVELPPGARVVGTSERCRYAALAYGRSGLSIQPHPEFTDAFVHGLLDVRGHVLQPEQRESTGASLGKPLATSATARYMRNFLMRTS